MPLLFFWLFLILLLYLHYLPSKEMRTDHVNNIPTLLTMVYLKCLHFFLICSDFLAILTLITLLGKAHRPLNCTSTLLPTLHHVSAFFPDFLIIFMLLTILGNAHRPYLNIVNNFTSCLSFFSWFFSWLSH